MKVLFNLIFFYLSLHVCYSQMWTRVGARANGLGHTTVALPDAFAIFSNPACLTGLQNDAIGLSVDHRYNVEGLNTLAMAYTRVQQNARIGFGASRYGDDLLSHTRAEMAFAYKIRMVSLGGGLSYQQFGISELGTAKNVMFQLGGMAEITPKITYAASVYNVTRARLINDYYYPVCMRMGLRYEPSKQVILLGEIEKISQQEANCKVALEYLPYDFLCFRTGINTFPSQGFVGLGLKWRGSELDYSCSFHSRLGFVHYVGIVFGFAKPESGK